MRKHWLCILGLHKWKELDGSSMYNLLTGRRARAMRCARRCGVGVRVRGSK